MAKSAKYNGHANYNAWNVSLWINNDEGLYDLARDCIRQNRRYGRDRAAQQFVECMQDCGAHKTPDGVPYSKTNVRRAMVGM
jgi:hypothetical protein